MMRSLLKLNKFLLVLSLYTPLGMWADTQTAFDFNRAGASPLYETSSSRMTSVGTDYRADVPVSSFSSTSSIRRNSGEITKPVESAASGTALSSYSVKGTSSFVDIHTDVANVQAQPEHTTGPRRIIRPTDPEIGVLPPDLPVGDAVLPLALMLVLYAGFQLLRVHRLSDSKKQ